MAEITARNPKGAGRKKKTGHDNFVGTADPNKDPKTGRFVVGNSGYQTNEFTPDEFYELACTAMDTFGKKAPTIAGLCVAMGISLPTFYAYGKREGYATAWQMIRTRLVAFWEGNLAASACTGSIFWLKNNADYRDVQRTELTGPDGNPVESITRVEVVGVAADGDGNGTLEGL